MRAALLLCLFASASTLAAPIDETRYQLEAVRSYTYSSDRFWSTVADGEHLIRMGDIFQRIALHPAAERPVELLDIGLPMSRAVDAARYAGALRVLEEEGTLWTPEGDARVRLSDDDLVWWYSTARAGDYLVCGGRGARFATLRPEPGGDLAIVQLESLPTVSAATLTGDRMNGFYYASYGPLRGARIDSTGHIVLIDAQYGDDTEALVSSPGLDHVYAAQDHEMVLYRVESPGRLTRVRTVQQGRFTSELSVWYDPEREVDRLALAYEDSLFVFEIDHTGASTLLLADDEVGDAAWPSPQCWFLDSGRLYYTDGIDRVWLRAGPRLKQRREMRLVHYASLDFSIAPAGDGWSVIGSPSLSGTSLVTYGTAMRAGFAAPGSRREMIAYGQHLTMNDTHIYAKGSHEFGQSIRVLERGDPLTLVDTLAVDILEGHDIRWSIERDFLITGDPVLDLSDPVHPTLLGAFTDHLGHYIDVLNLATRPFPGSETDILVALNLFEDNNSLAFYRISRQQGIEPIWSEQVEFSPGCSFDDTRDLLYESHSRVVWVYDVSDPYRPWRIHEHRIIDEGYDPAGRSIQHTLCEEGILHVSARNSRWGYSDRAEHIPFWFDGERLVPAGKPLHAPIRGNRPSGQGGYLPIRGSADGSILLTYDPPPLPRREECCGVDEWPPKE